MTLITQFTAEEKQALEEKKTFWRLLFLPGMFAGFLALYLDWPGTHPALTGAIWLATGYMMFCGISCLHEAVHQTLWPNKQASIILGRFIGTFVLIPYTVYREVHVCHHAWLNKPDDWELWPYTDPGCSLGFRRVFAWFDLLFGMISTPVIFGRIYFSKRSPVRKPSVRKIIGYEYLLIVAFWGTLATVTLLSGQASRIAWVMLPPWWIAGVIQTGRKFTEHLGMASYDPMMGTRTVIGKSWLSRVCTWMNFDIFVHGIHHRHPRMAHDQMRDKMAEYQRDNPAQDWPVYSSYWRATLSMLPHLFGNPGCGVNAGAPMPSRFATGQSLNFVADANELVEESEKKAA